MTTANISIHSQRSTHPAGGENSTGPIYAGLSVFEVDSAIRFAPPVDIAGATVTSITLTLRVKYVEGSGGVLIRLSLAQNTSNLASQTLNANETTTYDYLHSPTYSSFITPPASSEETTSAFASYTIDLTNSVDVANLEDDIIVLIQYSAYQAMMTGETAYMVIDGIGDTTPPSLEIVYTPAAGTDVEGDLVATDDDDAGTHEGSVLVIGESSESDGEDSGVSEGDYVATIGESSASDSPDAGASSGVVVLSGSLGESDSDDAGNQYGAALVAGESSIADDDDSGVSVGEQFGTFGNSDQSDGDDTGSLSGEMSIIGESSSTDADDSGLAQGSVFGVFGQSSLSDSNDTGLSAGDVQLTGSSSINDEDDSGIAAATSEAFPKRGFVPQGMFIRTQFSPGMNVGA